MIKKIELDIELNVDKTDYRGVLEIKYMKSENHDLGFYTRFSNLIGGKPCGYYPHGESKITFKKAYTNQKLVF